ncbi:MAG: photosynthetic complex putative assembly protein PuhB [Pseudomonadota bacterium]
MRLFHDEEHGPAEPMRGMPEPLPEGERVLWQGSPSALALAINAFRLRWVLGYFVLMTLFRLANSSSNASSSAELSDVLLSSVVFCGIAIVLIFGLSFAMSRAAIFTITNERVILRYGAAIRKYLNIPFSKIKRAQLKRKSARVGDISLLLEVDRGAPGYLHIWPFARPFQYSRPQPMMRGLEEPEMVASVLARAVYECAPDQVQLELLPADQKSDIRSTSKAPIPAT